MPNDEASRAREAELDVDTSIDRLMRRGSEERNYGRGRGSDQSFTHYGRSVPPRDQTPVGTSRRKRATSETSSLIPVLEEALGVDIETLRACYPKNGRPTKEQAALRRRVTWYLSPRVIHGQSALGWALALGCAEQALKRDIKKWLNQAEKN